MITLLATLSLAGLSLIVLLPAYAKEILHGSSDTLGYLMSALGAGVLIGAFYMASRKSVLGLGKIITRSVALLGLTIVLASFSGKLYFSLILFFCGRLSMILALSSINTMLQTIADEDKRLFMKLCLTASIHHLIYRKSSFYSAISINHL